MSNKNPWILCRDKLPEDIPEDEPFGVEYEVKYIDKDNKIKTTITEWLWEKEWNCVCPVIAWRPYNKIIKFPGNNK